MRAIFSLPLALLLVTSGFAKVIIHPDQTHAEHPLEESQTEITPEVPVQEVKPAVNENDYDYYYVEVEDEDGDEDDLTNDPDWFATEEDYDVEPQDELYEYLTDEEINEGIDYNDQDESNEQEEETNYDEHQDALWSSDEDPDWTPEEEEEEESQENSEEEVENPEDPDWEPTYEDYATTEIPEEEYLDEEEENEVKDYDEVDKERLDNILFDISLLVAEREGVSESEERLNDIFNKLKQLELSLEEALHVFDLLTQKENYTLSDLHHEE